LIKAEELELALKEIEEEVREASAPEEVELRHVPEPLKEDVERAIRGLFYRGERRGKFLVVTGIDKAGKETHCFNPAKLKGIRAIGSVLDEMGYRVLGVRQPSYETLLGRLVSSHLGFGDLIEGRVSKDYAWLLWSLDRAQHNFEVVDWLREEGNVVLSKRWCESNVVYQMAQGIDPGRIESFERGIAKQDYTILLDIPVEESLKRSASLDRYESPEFLRRVRELYLRLPLYYPYGELYVVDANRGLEEVNSDLVSLVEGLFGRPP